MPEPKQSPIDCLRCGSPLYFLGVRKFHEGSSPGVFGDFFEAFQHREELDMFACGNCGHVEFFVGGVGDELRGFEPEQEKSGGLIRKLLGRKADGDDDPA